MRAFLSALVLLTLLLAGCASGGGDGGDGSSTSQSASSSRTTTSASGTQTASASGTGSQTSTSTHSESANRPPTANLTAMTVALAVNFTIGASDADDDALTYVFQSGDGSANVTGTGPFPVAVNHTYGAAGLYNASVTVSDGKASTTAVLRVNVTEAAASGIQPVTFQGHADLPDVYNSLVVYPDGCAVGPITGAPSGTFGVTFQIGAMYEGWTWSITDGATTMWWGGGDILASGPTGVVPAGNEYVDTCIRPPGTDMDYVLTLTPA